MKKELTAEQKEKIKLYQKEYRQKNLEKRREYREKNKDVINQKTKEWREKNKETVLEKRKEYREINKEKINLKHKEWYENNPDAKIKKQIRDKNYHEKNKNNRNKYRQEKRKTDLKYKIECIIRTIINNSFIRNGYKKNSKTFDILSCSFEDFKQHIEALWSHPNNLDENGNVWMNWDNRGLYNGTPNYGWDIDHIIPSSSAITEEDVIKLNHYTNLQPMCSYYNRDVKRNLIIK